MALLRDVDLAADDRVDALGFGRVVELHRAEEVAVVGHGDGGHLLLDHEVHQLGDFAGAVEQGVVGVAVQVDEGGVGHFFLGMLFLGGGSYKNSSVGFGGWGVGFLGFGGGGLGVICFFFSIFTFGFGDGVREGEGAKFGQKA